MEKYFYHFYKHKHEKTFVRIVFEFKDKKYNYLPPDKFK